MADVRAEQERNNNGFYTFTHSWVAYKPGNTMTHQRGETDIVAEVVHTVDGGIFSDPISEWHVWVWSLEYEGQWLGRVRRKFTIDKFDGENPTQDDFLVAEYDDLEGGEDEEADKIIKTQLEYGKKYWNLLPLWDKPVLMDLSDLRNWATSCSCPICKDGKVTADGEQIASEFEDYNFISTDESELSLHQYLMLQQPIRAFIFGSQRWELLHVRHFQEPRFDEGIINQLVMNKGRKNLLKALSKSFTRRNKHDEVVSGDMWCADFVKGKGSGLIFLLHENSDVGKTYTAGKQCIAAFTRRPLMVFTPSDIGTSINDVENNLMKNFKTARSWGAVLLIDRQMSSWNSVQQPISSAAVSSSVSCWKYSITSGVNSDIPAFLRQLENYDGILFLTTNRVVSFDDAFISRIHVWKTFIEELAREKSESMRLNIDANGYIRDAKMRAVKWNGREIRNGKTPESILTAVALAEYDAEVDEEGKVVVNNTHFRSVVELSRDFEDYLKESHRGDESMRAQRKSERLDTFSTPVKGN
ncbi:hypothetical protein QQZ08_006491 [Neonectria magnoliae]|uniref:ATPase AAA-type core domain-containing protein n=1 Tax=Neonectria magnoliae TaxID=2732573 RepID=A0ABR1I1D6_9HYPO